MPLGDPKSYSEYGSDVSGISPLAKTSAVFFILFFFSRMPTVCLVYIVLYRRPPGCPSREVDWSSWHRMGDCSRCQGTDFVQRGFGVIEWSTYLDLCGVPPNGEGYSGCPNLCVMTGVWMASPSLPTSLNFSCSRVRFSTPNGPYEYSIIRLSRLLSRRIDLAARLG